MRKMLAALAVAAGLLVPTAPASAHIHDNYAALYCGVATPFSGSYTQNHAVPDHIQAEYVRYYCRQTKSATSYQFWVIRWWNGQWSMGSGYQNCALVACSEP